MLHQKEGLPEEGDIIICTVKKIVTHSVFVTLDEYKGKEGMIHISEVSPGRIRNLRDYVREGKTLVCKVLRVNRERGQVDLSLRRVSETLRAKKLNEMKQEQKSEKILEVIADKLKIKVEAVYEQLGKRIIDEYGNLTSAFQDMVLRGEEVLDELHLGKDLGEMLLEVVKERIKPPEVSIRGILKVQSEASDGVEVVKKALKVGEDLAKKKEYDIKLTYFSAPNYELEVKAMNYKDAEKALKDVSEHVIKAIKKAGGSGEFIRNE